MLYSTRRQGLLKHTEKVGGMADTCLRMSVGGMVCVKVGVLGLAHGLYLPSGWVKGRRKQCARRTENPTSTPHTGRSLDHTPPIEHHKWEQHKQGACWAGRQAGIVSIR